MLPIGTHIGFLLVMLLAALLFWGGLAALVVWAIRAFASRPRAEAVAPVVQPAAGTARQMLDERLVRGEVSVKEYEQIRTVLERE